MQTPPAFFLAAACAAACTNSALQQAAVQPEIRLIALQHVAAAELAEQLPYGEVEFDVAGLPGVNALLVKGSPERCDEFERLVRTLDLP
jgi:hypothetical protein